MAQTPTPAYQPERAGIGFQLAIHAGFQTQGAIYAGALAARVNLTSPTAFARRRGAPALLAARAGLVAVLRRRRVVAGLLAARAALAAPLRRRRVSAGQLLGAVGLTAPHARRRLAAAALTATAALSSVQVRARRVVGILATNAQLSSPASFTVQEPQSWSVTGLVQAAAHWTAITRFTLAGLGVTGTLIAAAGLTATRTRRGVPLALVAATAALTSLRARARRLQGALAARALLASPSTLTLAPGARTYTGLLSAVVQLASPASGQRPQPQPPVISWVWTIPLRWRWTGDLAIEVGLTSRSTFRRAAPKQPVRLKRPIPLHRHISPAHLGVRVGLKADARVYDYVAEAILPDDDEVLAVLAASGLRADVRDDDEIVLLALSGRH